MFSTLKPNVILAESLSSEREREISFELENLMASNNVANNEFAQNLHIRCANQCIMLYIHQTFGDYQFSPSSSSLSSDDEHCVNYPNVVDNHRHSCIHITLSVLI